MPQVTFTRRELTYLDEALALLAKKYKTDFPMGMILDNTANELRDLRNEVPAAQ